MQDCLAALYLNAPLRRRFHENPDFILQDYYLNAREKSALCNIDATALELYASSLNAKRRRRLIRAFPALFGASEKLVGSCFDRFVSLFYQRPNQSIHKDVVDFGQYSEQYLAANRNAPEWLAEVARYERLRYVSTYLPIVDSDLCARVAPGRTSRPHIRSGVSIADFQYDVPAIVTAIRAHSDMAFSPDPRSIVFRHSSRQSRAEMIRINDATRMLLRYCDGHRTVDELVSVAKTEFNQSDLEGETQEVLGRLFDLGILGLRAADSDSPHPSGRDQSGNA